MQTKQVRLLTGAHTVKTEPYKDGADYTTITFYCPRHNKLQCRYVVSGRWEIQRIDENVVTLVNYDQVIKCKS